MFSKEWGGGNVNVEFQNKFNLCCKPDLINILTNYDHKASEFQVHYYCTAHAQVSRGDVISLGCVGVHEPNVLNLLN